MKFTAPPAPADAIGVLAHRQRALRGVRELQHQARTSARSTAMRSRVPIGTTTPRSYIASRAASGPAARRRGGRRRRRSAAGTDRSRCLHRPPGVPLHGSRREPSSRAGRTAAVLAVLPCRRADWRACSTPSLILATRSPLRRPSGVNPPAQRAPNWHAGRCGASAIGAPHRAQVPGRRPATSTSGGVMVRYSQRQHVGVRPKKMKAVGPRRARATAAGPSTSSYSLRIWPISAGGRFHAVVRRIA